MTGLALAATAAAPAPAPAAPPAPTEPAFALTAVGSPGAVLLPGTPGRVLRGQVRVRNVSARRITVKLHAADVQNAANGNADYVTTDLSRTGRWLHLKATTVRLAPNASRRIDFTVRIPQRARGASHYAGIVAIDAADLTAQGTRKAAKRKSFNFNRISRQALPLTIRLPGPRTRRLAARSAKIVVEPAGAALMLGLLPGGTTLIKGAQLKVRVQRDGRTVVAHKSTLGQLFPGTGLDYRIPWAGQPTAGTYQVRGIIRPQGAPAVKVSRTVTFSPTAARQLKAVAPAAPSPPTGLPIWVWLALTTAAVLLTTLSLAVWKLARRPAQPVH